MMARFRSVLSIPFCALVALGCCNGTTGPTAPGRTVETVATPDREVEHGEPEEFGFGGGAWDWESRGLGGGGAFLAATINPHDPNDLSISTDMGMNFRSVDFGRSWFGMHFETLRGSDRTTLRWTSDPAVVYSIDQQGWEGAYPIRSTDSGRSWTRLPNDPTEGNAHWIHEDPSQPGRVLVSSWSELFFSDNGAESWERIHSAPVPENGLYVAGVAWAGETLIVGTAEAMLVSSDGGGTWSETTYRGLPEG